jgi:hypothetical protein
MGGWVASGAVRYKEDLRPGLEQEETDRGFRGLI